jgi:hypothetical protein
MFQLPNPSSRTTALGSTQPLTEMSTKNLPGVKGGRCVRLTNRTAICDPIVQKMWEPRRLTTLWAFTACYRDNFTFYLSITCSNLEPALIICTSHYNGDTA